MSNMGYCRFENTARDLEDCQDNMSNDDLELSETETHWRLEIIRMCCEIADNWGHEYED